jgi:hypothetical protein
LIMERPQGRTCLAGQKAAPALRGPFSRLL